MAVSGVRPIRNKKCISRTTLLVARLLLIVCIGGVCYHVAMSQAHMVRGVMEKTPDRSFKGQDSVFEHRSLVWSAKELKNPDTVYQLRENIPDPYSQGLDVHFQLAAPESVRISYYDSGRHLLSTPYAGILQKGQYTFHVTGSELPRGNYIIKTSIGRKTWIQRGGL